MPNMKNAKKKVLVIAKKKKSNNEYKASMRTAIKSCDKAIAEANPSTANQSLNLASKKIDKAVSKGLIKKNTAARQKSRLTKQVNNIEKNN